MWEGGAADPAIDSAQFTSLPGLQVTIRDPTPFESFLKTHVRDTGNRRLAITRETQIHFYGLPTRRQLEFTIDQPKNPNF